VNRRLALLAAVVGSTVWALPLAAQDQPADATAQPDSRVVIYRVRLIGRLDPSLDVTVNLLIEGGRLGVVTREPLVTRPEDLALDAVSGWRPPGGPGTGRMLTGIRPANSSYPQPRPTGPGHANGYADA
jgi:hypothetical protein